MKASRGRSVLSDFQGVLIRHLGELWAGCDEYRTEGDSALDELKYTTPWGQAKARWVVSTIRRSCQVHKLAKILRSPQRTVSPTCEKSWNDLTTAERHRKLQLRSRMELGVVGPEARVNNKERLGTKLLAADSSITVEEFGERATVSRTLSRNQKVYVQFWSKKIKWMAELLMSLR